DLYRRVREQHGDTLDGDAFQEQFHRQRVPEPMRVASLHAGDFAQATEGAAPVSGERLFRTDTGPEPVAIADARARFEGLNDEWRKRDVHRSSGCRGTGDCRTAGLQRN